MFADIIIMLLLVCYLLTSLWIKHTETAIFLLILQNFGQLILFSHLINNTNINKEMSILLLLSSLVIGFALFCCHRWQENNRLKNGIDYHQISFSSPFDWLTWKTSLVTLLILLNIGFCAYLVQTNSQYISQQIQKIQDGFLESYQQEKSQRLEDPNLAIQRHINDDYLYPSTNVTDDRTQLAPFAQQYIEPKAHLPLTKLNVFFFVYFLVLVMLILLPSPVLLGKKPKPAKTDQEASHVNQE